MGHDRSHIVYGTDWKNELGMMYEQYILCSFINWTGILDLYSDKTDAAEIAYLYSGQINGRTRQSHFLPVSQKVQYPVFF